MGVRPPDITSKAEGSWQRGLLLLLLSLVKKENCQLALWFHGREAGQMDRYVNQLKLNFPAGNQETPVPRWGGVSVMDPGGQSQRSVYGWGQ